MELLSGKEYMERNDISMDMIRSEVSNFFASVVPTRNITIRTGVGGMDLFEETWDNQCGYTRIYAGKKISRIIRNTFKFFQSHSGRWYRRIKSKNAKQD